MANKLKELTDAFMSGDLTEILTKYSDIFLAVLVVGILGMMLIPLPTFLLDILLTTNITLAITILLVTLYVPSAVKFSSFPTVLLITTLFRLALNISSTRLILLYAYAGEVIKSFGQFVVKGNYVVGAVIFLIITIIQFIVISKGAERVAEVAARFTLDALPGKQMSIDADLRAGTITMEEAKKKRMELQRESQLYGSMDGAMKFVKGDAIAGIIITLINIIGGLIIGVMQKGMQIGEAAQTYTLLTIGDGLVSQIPALLISTSAGMVVTRVASEFEDSHLGKDIGTQILSQPKAIAIASGLLIGLGLVPGLPTVPFFIMAAIVGTLAYGLLRTKVVKTEEAEKAKEAETKAIEKKKKRPEGLISLVTPLALEVSKEISPYIDSAKDDGRFINELLPMVREAIYQELGVRLPGVKIRGYVASLPPDIFVIKINEIPIVTGKVLFGKVLTSASAQDLKIFRIQAIPYRNPATGAPASWVPEQSKEMLLKSGYKVWDIPDVMILHLSAVMKKYAHEFLGIQEVQTMLDQMQQAFPALVKEVTKVTTPLLLSDVLKRMVKEEISIRDFRNVLQAIAKWAAIEKDPVMLTEYVRAELKEYISYKFSAGKKILYVHLLDPRIEEIIRESIRQTPAGNFLDLDPEFREDLNGILYKEFKNIRTAKRPPIVLTSMDVRPYFKRLIEPDFPNIIVLSYQELTLDTRIQPVGQIRLA